MLVFDRPVAHVGNAFLDDADPHLAHLLPDRLAPIVTDGTPELSLVLHVNDDGEGGGVFQGRFAGSMPSFQSPDGMEWTRAAISGCNVRVTPRTQVPGAEDLMTWRAAVTDGEGGVLIQLLLDARSALLMRRLALGDDRVLDLSFDLEIPGRAQGVPVTAELPGVQLWDHLSAQLGAAPTRPVDIERAFLSLPKGLITFHAMGRTSLPDTDRLLRETAARARALIFDPDPDGGHVLIERDRMSRLRVALDTPRTEIRTHRIDWSMGDFVAGLDAAGRARHFPQIRTIEPFADVDIHVLNQIPLDSRNAMQAVVDLSFPGPGGTPENSTLRFRPDDPIAATQRTRYPAITQAFEVSSRVKLVLAPGPGGGFPRFWPPDPTFEPATNPFMILVSPKRLQVTLIHLVADDGIFDLCSAVRATFGHDGGETVAMLTPDAPEARVVLTGHRTGTVYALRIEALPPPSENDAADHVVRDGPETETTVLVARVDLMVRAPNRITCQIGDDAIRFAVLDVASPFSGYVTTRVLRPGQTTEIAVWRPSVFSTLAYDWRAAIVREDEDGQPRPMTQGNWARTSEKEIALI